MVFILSFYYIPYLPQFSTVHKGFNATQKHRELSETAGYIPTEIFIALDTLLILLLLLFIIYLASYPMVKAAGA